MTKTLAAAKRQERVKFKVPRSVQDAIPIRRIWPDGIFQVGNQYSKSWSFTDINYAIADKDDKMAMFLDYHPRKGVYEKPYPKNEKARYLPMTPTIEAILKEHLAWLDAEKEKWGDLWVDSDYIFTAEHGGPMNPDTITKYFGRMSKLRQKENPNFPHINPHAFRHTVASLLLNNGVDLISVADFVGDDPATIAKYYAHLVNAGKTRAANTMAAVLGLAEQNADQNAS